MRELYNKGEANYPRLKTDKFFADYENVFKYTGFFDDAVKYIEEFQLLREDLWKRFVQQFRAEDSDFDDGWKGEYWGKMMRGACFTYSYNRNPKLYEALKAAVIDMISVAEPDGRISSYGRNHEFNAWDMWSRKYVLLGMQYFMEICDDEALKADIIECMKGQVDYIMTKIGPGKKDINTATKNWRGLNSSSILEPIVRLYVLTEEQKYLDFAKYIVDCGGTSIVNIFELAYQNKLKPYQYPVTKAYEMTSCFEGLLEYYRVVGNERDKEAVVNFADMVLDTDFTIIGSSGCTHELLDHSTVRQANTTNGAVMQETCVTVTLMKFLYQVTLITGDPKYTDAFETALYNGYLGAINTDKVIEPTLIKNHSDWAIEPLPFDSYSPLTAGTRGNGIGGLQHMADNHYYGCCACIGSAGIGIAPKMALLTTENGIVLNLFMNGETLTKTPSGAAVTVKSETKYPVCGKVKFTLSLENAEKFDILVRNPAWSETTTLAVNGEAVSVNDGYIKLSREWKSGDTIELMLDMRTRALRPIPYGSDILMNTVNWRYDYALPTYDEEDPIAKNHIALIRGPIVLAQENRLGYSVDDPVDIEVKDGYVDVKFPEKDIAPYAHIIELEVPLTNGSVMHVTDYASTGKLWTEESKMAAWMLTV